MVNDAAVTDGRPRFANRTAIVTGAGGDIGATTAVRLAEEGARVVLADVGGSLDATAEACAAANPDVAPTVSRFDVTSEDEVRRAFDELGAVRRRRRPVVQQRRHPGLVRQHRRSGRVGLPPCARRQRGRRLPGAPRLRASADIDRTARFDREHRLDGAGRRPEHGGVQRVEGRRGRARRRPRPRTSRRPRFASTRSARRSSGRVRCGTARWRCRPRRPVSTSRTTPPRSRCR